LDGSREGGQALIPEALKSLVESQMGDVRRKDRAAAERALQRLGIAPDSEFGEFFLAYRHTLFRSDASYEKLVDLADPTEQIASGTRFAHEVWELPEELILLTSGEGEGGYLWNKRTGTVSDFSLADQKAFLRGEIPPRWGSFFEFMTWYLTPTSPRGR
jgi:hypothetical protein